MGLLDVMDNKWSLSSLSNVAHLVSSLRVCSSFALLLFSSFASFFSRLCLLFFFSHVPSCFSLPLCSFFPFACFLCNFHPRHVKILVSLTSHSVMKGLGFIETVMEINHQRSNFCSITVFGNQHRRNISCFATRRPALAHFLSSFVCVLDI